MWRLPYAVIRVGRVPTKEAFFREDKKAEMPTEVALPLDKSQRDAATCLQRFPSARTRLQMLRELSTYDLHDVYRRLHGYGEQTREEGWRWCYRDQFKYRFDHVFASDTLYPMQAQYLHSFPRTSLERSQTVGGDVCARCI